MVTGFHNRPNDCGPVLPLFGKEAFSISLNHVSCDDYLFSGAGLSAVSRRLPAQIGRAGQVCKARSGGTTRESEKGFVWEMDRSPAKAPPEATGKRAAHCIAAAPALQAVSQLGFCVFDP